MGLDPSLLCGGPRTGLMGTGLMARDYPNAIVPPDGYPDGNPKTRIGLTKPPLRCIPPVAILQIGQAMKDGERKYGLMNWREHTVSASVYYDAALRHLLAWWDGEDTASDSGVDHLAHVAACMAIVMDAKAAGKLNDDRPLKGQASALIAEKTAA